MPQLINGIDEYFREKKRDLYYIVFGDKSDPGRLISDNPTPPGSEELREWFAQNLPDVKIEPIYPFSYKSGILSAPYCGSFSIDFNEQTLATFCACWEDSNGGSIDPRFQCYHYPLSVYLERNGGEFPSMPWDDPDWNP